jgi:hypothetical protein
MVDYVATLYASAEVEEYEQARELDTGDFSAVWVRAHMLPPADLIPVYAVWEYQFEALASATKDELRERVRDNVETGDLGELQVRGVSRVDE